ncbi:MAG: heparinase II/III family protein, partial [bacterium]
MFLLLVVINQKALGLTHPHIIVKESDYPNLRTRSEKLPWSAMKSKAINDAKNFNYDSGASYSSKCTRAHDIASACALAYILDPNSRSIYIEKVETQLAQAIDYIRTEKGNKTDHSYNVAPAHAAFMVYLVLDVMYNDLSTSKRQEMENDCDYIAANHTHSWNSSEYSIKGMMELYHNGKTTLFESIKDDYLEHVLSLTSDDGVYTTGPGYVKSRIFMDDRLQKKIFMDICEYQGYNEFYNNHKLKNLYEWILGYSVTPFNRTYTFGDSPPTKDLDHWAVSALRVNRFSEKAQRYASWQLGPLTDNMIKGRLLHYILCDSMPKPALRPVSRIFKNGGVWLLEDSDSDRALAGAMWNINTTESSHNHFDVNAIHIAAYGEHVLRNSGYDGYGKPNPATWEWIRRTAESSNTVLIDGRNHMTWRAGGITEGLIGGDLEYASGSSGYTLPIAQHQRNFIFVKPQTGINHGYFVIIDEVKTAFNWATNSQVNVVWHPNSSLDPVILEDKKQYRWNIEGCNYSGHNVGVTIFLGSIPESVEIKTGYLGSYSECSRFQGKYLYSTHKTNGQGKASVMSVIFPHDDSHPVADIERIDTSGVKIDHGNMIVDHILSTTDTSIIRHNEIILKGHAVLFRQHDWNIESYFMRKG